jgi:hypothetical protein
VNPNVEADGTQANAVWVDLDLACGQCHGGGNLQASTAVTTGTTAVLTVASSTGFEVGARIRIKGAGALEADGITREDFNGNVKSIDSPTQITLLGAASIPVTGKTLEQNPTRNGAGYMTKAQLAPLALGMHEDKPDARFNITTSGLTVNVDASASTCSGSAANCNAYAWQFFTIPVPPATPVLLGTRSGKTASYPFAASGTYTITLTVTQYATGPSTVSKTVTVNGPGPTAVGTCTFEPNTWKATVTNNSVAGTGSNSPLRSVAVFWGDGSAIAMDKTPTTGETYVHTYQKVWASAFVLKLKATDSRGRQSTINLNCTPAVAPAYFYVAGTVQTAAPAPIAIARVQLFLGTKLVRAMYSSPTGTFKFEQLRPGAYTVVVTKTGYTFPASTPATVGASKDLAPIVATSIPTP